MRSYAGMSKSMWECGNVAPMSGIISVFLVNFSNAFCHDNETFSKCSSYN